MRAAGTAALAPLLLLAALLAAARPLDTGHNAEIVNAARQLLAALTPEQRARASFSFDDPERLNWHYIPRERRGLPIKAMSEAQRAAARQLLVAGMGQRGLAKATRIMELEQVLRDMGGDPAVRDPELYFFSVFGTPSADAPWGWRVEGHHLSVNFTHGVEAPVAPTPAFFGANPARVPSGPRAGLRVLAGEEDIARELVLSLSDEQRATAIIAAEAPRDIITGNAAEVDPLSPVGVPVGQLGIQQSALLFRLIDLYLARMAWRVAADQRARIEQHDVRRITFAWAGSLAPNEPHYYRIQGPTFVIEYDNTQNGANHIHSVWRDFEGDFGRDLLREHYRDAPHAH